MKRLLGLLLVTGMVGCGDPVAELEKLGAKIRRNAEGEVVRVDFSSSRPSDAGLVHLKGLTNLQHLDLIGDQITDAGLVHLEALTGLETLVLSGTQITDAGLVHLKGLTNLESLALASYTKITDAAITELKQALPNLQIEK